MLLYYLFFMLMGLFLHFYIIFGTNLLTQGPVQIAVFLPISVFHRKGISNGMKPSGTWFSQQTWSRRLGVGVKKQWRQPRGRGRAYPPGRALHPRGPSIAPPTYFFLLYISTYPPIIQEHHENLIPPLQPSVLERSHLGAFSEAPPGGGIDHGGPLHQLHGLSGDVWVVYFRPTGP